MVITLKSIVFACISISAVLGKCTTVHQRKEIRSLSKDELQRYANAVKKLHAQKDPLTGLSGLETFSKIHVTHKDKIHRTPLFFPWHRYFIREYEKALQKIDPSVHLPYWDWSLDASEPAKSVVLSNSMFGSHGDYQSGSNCVIDGLFSGLKFNYPNNHCLRRRYNQDEDISSFSSFEQLNPYLNSAKFSSVSKSIEGPHGTPHTAIGGYRNDFWDMHSPNDPLFYLHHGFIDLLWNEWQKRHPRAVQYEGDAFNMRVSKSQSLLEWKATVGDTIDTLGDNFCYTYPRYPPTSSSFSSFSSESSSGNSTYQMLNPLAFPKISSNPLVSGILSNLPMDQLISKLKLGINLLLPPIPGSQQKKPIKKSLPLPEEWLKMNGFDVQEMRAQEKLEFELIDLLNKIPNFIPYENMKKGN